MNAGDTGHEQITAEALRPMLEELKDQIVADVSQQVTASLGAQITRQFIEMLESRVEAVVKPIRDELREMNDRSSRHSKRLGEVEKHMVAQTDQNSQVMSLFAKTDERFDHVMKSIDALIESNQNMRVMIEFHTREITETRDLANKAQQRLEDSNSRTDTFRRDIGQNINTISNSIVEAGRRMQKIEDGQKKITESYEEVSEFLGRVNVLAGATVLLTQGDTIVRFVTSLLGG